MRQTRLNQLWALCFLGVATACALLVSSLLNAGQAASPSERNVLVQSDNDFLDLVADQAIIALRTRARGLPIVRKSKPASKPRGSNRFTVSTYDEIEARVNKKEQEIAARIAKQDQEIADRIEKHDREAEVRVFGSNSSSNSSSSSAAAAAEKVDSSFRTALSRWLHAGADKASLSMLAAAGNVTDPVAYDLPIRYGPGHPEPGAAAAAAAAAAGDDEDTRPAWFGDAAVPLGERNPSVFAPAGRQRPDYQPSGPPTAMPPTVSECPSLLCKQRKLEALGVNTGERHRQWSDRLTAGGGVEDSYRLGPSPRREWESSAGMYADILDGDQP